MLKEGNKYTAVADRDERFDLGEVKNELLQAIGLNTEAPGSVFSFLRTGYKVCLAHRLAAEHFHGCFSGSHDSANNSRPCSC